MFAGEHHLHDMKFTTFDEMFKILWKAIGAKEVKERQKYRRLMLKVRDQMKQNITPSTYQQDKIWDYYREVIYGETKENEEEDVRSD